MTRARITGAIPARQPLAPNARPAIVAAMPDSDPEELDTTGLLCPLPVLKARKRLSVLPGGALLRVLADDPAARVDFPHFCQEQGHELVSTDERGRTLEFLIRKTLRR